MSKLFNLKEWLTVADAARHLSIVLGEEVTEADVLRLGLDGRLRLSAYFVNGTSVRCGKPSEELAMQIDAGHKPLQESFALLSGDLRVVPLGKLTWIHGVWDIPMLDGDRRDIENRYQILTEGPPVPGSNFDGTFVEGADGELCQIQEAVDGGMNVNTGNCYPSERLPHDAVIVVRTKALREFERHSIDSPLPTSHTNVSDKLAKMNQASMKFWSNADRDDRGTHPENATVAVWLVKQGFSPTLADKAATIIRPEWAPTGRKPE